MEAAPQDLDELELVHEFTPPHEGVRLHYVSVGRGPLVVLLHGFPEYWGGWHAQIARLVEAGFRVVAPDLRGYGQSDKPEPVEAYFLERLAGDVAHLLRHLDAGPAVVVGHDWGGAVAWLHAMLHPEQVKRLAVLNMPHPAIFAAAWKTWRQKLKSFYFYFFRLRGFAAFVYRRFRAFGQRFMLYFFSRRTRPWRAFDHYAAEGLRPGAMKAMMSWYAALLAREPEALMHQVRPLRLPVLVLWGDEDPAFGERLADPGDHVERDGLQVRYLRGAGHFIHLERVDEVSEALAVFARDA